MAPHGVVYSMPSSDVLAVYILGTGKPVEAMLSVVAIAAFEEERPLSRDGYLRAPDGAIEQLSNLAQDCGVQFTPTERFLAAMAAAAPKA